MTNQCKSCGGFCKKSGCERENVKPTPQRKPLTNEQIKDIRVACGSPLAIHIEFARAIEAAHGIKE
jgi:hypothetical protein